MRMRVRVRVRVRVEGEREGEGEEEREVESDGGEDEGEDEDEKRGRRVDQSVKGYHKNNVEPFFFVCIFLTGDLSAVWGAVRILDLILELCDCALLRPPSTITWIEKHKVIVTTTKCITNLTQNRSENKKRH